MKRKYILSLVFIAVISYLMEKFKMGWDKKKTLLRRLKNIGMASEKLYRNTLKESRRTKNSTVYGLPRRASFSCRSFLVLVLAA